MRVFIIEDEELSVERLEKQLKALFPSVEIVGSAHSVRSAVNWLTLNSTPDLILMDMELGDGQCFNIFRQTDINSAVIFTTSFDESSMQVFTQRNIDYLLKPIKKTDLEKCVNKFLQGNNQVEHEPLDINGIICDLKKHHHKVKVRQRLLVRNGHGLKPIEAEEIAYLFADGKHYYLKTWDKETYAIDHSLDEVQLMLDPDSFHRLNKVFLVNEKSVANIHTVNNYLRVNLQPSHEREIIVSKDAIPPFLKSY